MFANSNFRACVAGSAKRGSTQARVAESPKPHNHTNYNSRSESSMSKLQTTTVDKKGRVKIPKILLENLGLEAPATLAIGIEGGAVVMTLHPTPGERIAPAQAICRKRNDLRQDRRARRRCKRTRPEAPGFKRRAARHDGVAGHGLRRRAGNHRGLDKRLRKRGRKFRHCAIRQKSHLTSNANITTPSGATDKAHTGARPTVAAKREIAVETKTLARDEKPRQA